MGRIVVTEFVSLDGVMEDPGGSEHSKHGAWTFKFNRGEEGQQVQGRRGPERRGAAIGPRDL